VNEAEKPRIKAAFDALHQSVYGQSAPAEDAEIVTFRVQSEIEVPRLVLPDLAQGDGTAASAKVGRRNLYDLEQNRYAAADVYDRDRLRAGNEVDGPAVVQQFDSTIVILAGQRGTVTANGMLEIEEREAT
jgi:N-methylhydantoinase A